MIDISTGIISTIAGNHPEQPNEFELPYALTVDAQDNIYVTDTILNQIKIIK